MGLEGKSVKKLSSKGFYLIVISGFILPAVIGLPFVVLYDSDIFEVGDLIGSFVLNGLFNSIPFLGIAILARAKLKSTVSQSYGLYYRRVGGIIGAVIFVVGISIFCNVVFWTDLTGDSPSSTGMLAFLFLPYYALLLMPIGYGIGYSLMAKIKRVL